MKLNQTSYRSPINDWVVSDAVIIPTRGLGRAAGELARQAQEAQRSRGSSGGAWGKVDLATWLDGIFVGKDDFGNLVGSFFKGMYEI